MTSPRRAAPQAEASADSPNRGEQSDASPGGPSDQDQQPHRSAVRGSDERGASSSDDNGITDQEIEDVESRSSPRAPVIYEIVRRMGDEEMARPLMSLWWSGIAAGMSISFSLLAQAILQHHLPDAPWRPLISNFGYCVGFIMAVLSRQQLFTENTVTAVLPLAAEPGFFNFWKLGRMWGIVLLANFAGTLLAAAFCTFTPVLPTELYDTMLALSRLLLGHGWWFMFFSAITAGFLMAAMVWMLPMAEMAQFHVITLMTYLIAVGGFMHIVAGSMEAFLLVLHGDASIGWMLGSFVAPVLAGNIVGGTALFALISYAQVMQEL
jgi:formate-nitrite transporter family protein